MKQKLVVIVGPTSSGKSDLGVFLARVFKGEIISADSRQVYKGLDIGSGKITKKEMMGVPHYLLDVVSPKIRFNISEYQKRALKALDNIIKKEKLPFLVGGSPLYVYSLVDGWEVPEVKPNPILRKRLEKKTVEELFSQLKKLDPRRANTIEQKNKRRLVRALEIVLSIKKPVPQLVKHPIPYSILFVGITRTPAELKKRIQRRFEKRFKRGMVQEVKRLHKQGLSWKRLEELGLEYRYIALYLQNKITKQEMREELLKKSLGFVKRQMTWFSAHGRSASGKKNPIHWVKNSHQAETLVRQFLFKKEKGLPIGNPFKSDV